MPMNVINKRWRNSNGLYSVLRIEPAVSTAETEHFGHTVAIMQFKKQRANDVVEARAQTAARHDSGTRFLRVEEKLCTWAGFLEPQTRLSTRFDPLRNMYIVTYRVREFLCEARFTECRRVHRNRMIARTCAERIRKRVVSG